MFHQNKKLDFGSVAGSIGSLMLTEIAHDTFINELLVEFTDSILITDTLFNGHLSACRHGNGRDWWIIQPELLTNGYYKFLATSNGIIEMNRQKIGDTLQYLESSTGGAVFSPDGTKYANYSRFADIQIYDFDRCTGAFSNPIHIEIPDEIDWSSGIAFSPNSRFLYLSYYRKIYQIDLHATNIPSSLLLIAEWENLGTPGLACFFGKAQLGSDGKIYIGAPGGRTCYHSIQEPDSFGIACQFIQDHELPTGINGALPYYPNFRLGKWEDSPCDTIEIVSTENLKEIPTAPVQIYPNPTADMFIIKKIIEDEKNYEWKLMNQLGQAVKRGQLDDRVSEVSVLDIPQGVYYFLLKEKRGWVQLERVVVLRG